MAGEVELGAETLGAALRAAVAEVEDELRRRGRADDPRRARAGPRRPRRSPPRCARRCATPPATRPARRSSSSPRPRADGAEVFVRDEGPGFELGVGPDRAARRARLDHRPHGRGRRLRRDRLAAGRGHRGRAADRGDGVKIVVVDDHHLFRAGVRAELAAHHEVVGEAATPAEALAVIAATAPDVVLLDVHLPDGGGVRVLEALAGSGPKVLALSVSDAAEDVVPMIRAGALGYVTKTIDTAELLDAIETVAAGDACFSPAAGGVRPAGVLGAGQAAVRARVAHPARARGPAPPRARLRLQAHRAAARDLRPDGRDPRRQRPAQAAAQLAPRGQPLGRDPRPGRRRRSALTASGPVREKRSRWTGVRGGLSPQCA